MNYVKFNQEISLSQLGMGVMRLPQKGKDSKSPIDYEKAEQLIDYCFNQGINYFDTAYTYNNGESEIVLGKALKKYLRESFYIADKYHIMAKKNYQEQFEEQLKRLQMDYIDFYLLHSVFDSTVSDYLTNGCIEYFLEQKAKGKIRHLGFSLHGSVATLQTTLDHHRWDFAQIQLNYYDWYHGIAKEQYHLLTERKIPIMVMEPLHGGMLVSLTDEGNAKLLATEPERTIASWGLRFLIGMPDVSVILSGIENIEQAKENIATIEENKMLSDTELELLKESCALLYESVAATCTSCRYCCEDCPQGLDIPALLVYYNELKLGGSWRLAGLKAFAKDKMPSACIGCGVCKQHCPQNLDIQNFMEKMAKLGY